MHIYIYMYRERDRERHVSLSIYIYIYTYICIYVHTFAYFFRKSPSTREPWGSRGQLRTTAASTRGGNVTYVS